MHPVIWWQSLLEASGLALFRIAILKDKHREPAIVGHEMGRVDHVPNTRRKRRPRLIFGANRVKAFHGANHPISIHH